MRHLDGYVLPVPKKDLAAYSRSAEKAGKIWREHGPLEYLGEHMSFMLASTFLREHANGIVSVSSTVHNK
jgi:uncharacterized protein YbaA (DUF1428 family)